MERMIEEMELPLENGTISSIEEREKEKEKRDKEANKIFKQAAKIVDEINDAEIKPFKEKLTLPESDDNVLNESEEVDELEYDGLNNYSAIISDELESDFPGVELVDLSLVDGGRNLEVVLSYNDELITAIINDVFSLDDNEISYELFNNIQDSLDEIDESLNEAVPKDLADRFKQVRSDDMTRSGEENNRYARAGYKGINAKPGKDDGRYNKKLDFQNSNYEEITPEEAMALKKAGQASKVIAIFDNQMVTFNDEGKQIYKATKRYRSNGDLYIRPRVGDIAKSSASLVFATVISRAEKLYKADEVDVDTNLLQNRRENPESAASTWRMPNRGVDDSTRLRGSDSYNYGSGVYSWKSIDDVKKNMDNAKNDADVYKAKLDVTDPSDSKYNDLKSDYEYALNKYKEYRTIYNKYLQREKDIKAGKRYGYSMSNLREPFEKFEELTNKINRAKRNATMAKTHYDNAIANGGSDKLRGARNDLDREKSRLEEVMRQIRALEKSVARYELLLSSAEEDDAEEIQKLENEMNDKISEVEAVQNQLDTLLKRNKKKESLDIDSKTQLNESAISKIKEAGKMSEFNDLLDELYPEGVTVGQVKDILTNEEDYILDSLGI